MYGVGFSADGQFLASSSDDRTIILWNLNQAVKLENVLAYGCQWIADYLRTNPKLSESDRQLCDGSFRLCDYLDSIDDLHAIGEAIADFS